MILTTILAIIAILLILFAVLILTVGGAVGIALFSDLIVCIVLVVLLIKWIRRKKH